MLTDLQAMRVECNVCRAGGVYAVPAPATLAEEQANWVPLACFFTPGCIGHVWPETPN